ncbi:unnamed protein product [Cutaneotrichosporon oleaginosum]
MSERQVPARSRPSVSVLRACPERRAGGMIKINLSFFVFAALIVSGFTRRNTPTSNTYSAAAAPGALAGTAAMSYIQFHASTMVNGYRGWAYKKESTPPRDDATTRLRDYATTRFGLGALRASLGAVQSRR